MPGWKASAHPLPHEITPARYHREPLLHDNGPPESPYRVKLEKNILKILQAKQLQMFINVQSFSLYEWSRIIFVDEFDYKRVMS